MRPLLEATLLPTSEVHLDDKMWSRADKSFRYGNAIVTFDKRAESKLRLKIDLCIVPTVALLYLFCFIDRANVGE